MRIKTKASIHINAPREKVWEYVSNLENLPQYFFGWGPLPGIKKVEIITGDKTMAVGMKQRTTTTDGRVIEENILTVRKPEYFDYKLKGFGFPFDLFVREGGGSWTFVPNDKGTTVTWNYYFNLTSPLVYPIGVLLVQFFYQHALAAALKQAKKQIENKERYIA